MYLSEFPDITNALPLESGEVRGDVVIFEIDDTGERLVEQRSDGKNREVASFRLDELH